MLETPETARMKQNEDNHDLHRSYGSACSDAFGSYLQPYIFSVVTTALSFKLGMNRRPLIMLILHQ